MSRQSQSAHNRAKYPRNPLGGHEPPHGGLRRDHGDLQWVCTGNLDAAESHAGEVRP
jgi:hypothetical protein